MGHYGLHCDLTKRRKYEENILKDSREIKHEYQRGSFLLASLVLEEHLL
ncbi:MAG: hypothetical protein ACI9FN_003592 [Saprospiraceae bacterium]|jgi:hypothetical protein